VKVFDGPSVVHTLSTKQASIFDQYSDEVFLPWTKNSFPIVKELILYGIDT